MITELLSIRNVVFVLILEHKDKDLTHMTGHMHSTLCSLFSPNTHDQAWDDSMAMQIKGTSRMQHD